MSHSDLTRKWLREAYREEIDDYMRQEPGDTRRQEQEQELYEALYHLVTDSASQVIF